MAMGISVMIRSKSDKPLRRRVSDKKLLRSIVAIMAVSAVLVIYYGYKLGAEYLAALGW